MIKARLSKFKIKNFDIFFIHNFDNLSLLEIKKVLIELEKFKKKKLIKNIGVSIYNKNSISKIIKLKQINFVQFPLSIIDRRFLSNKIISKLKKNNIKIQVRSIFAQGLIFRESFSKKIDNFIREINNLKIEILDVCLFFIRKFKFIDSVVIGINSFDQLRQIESSFQKVKPNKKKMNKIVNKLKQSSFDLRKLHTIK